MRLTHRWTAIATVIFFVGTGFTTGCSDSDKDSSGPSDDGLNKATKVIGEGGGRIEAGGATLNVPAGAVESDVEITVERVNASPPSEVEAVSSLYEFRPDGLEFEKPVEVHLPVEAPEDAELLAIYWGGEREDGEFGYEPLPTTVEEDEIWATVEHFTRGFGGRPPKCNGGRCIGGVPCVGGYCYVPDCDNGRENGFETDVDCGGVDCNPCTAGKRCDVNADCLSDQCIDGACASDEPADAGHDAASDVREDTEDGAEDSGPGVDDGGSGDPGDAPDVDETDAGGSDDWVSLVGGQKGAVLRDIVINDAGTIYAVGSVGGPVANESYSGGTRDALVAAWGTDGTRKWVDLIGSKGAEQGWRAALDDQGNLVVVGQTNGHLGGGSGPVADHLFFAKYDDGGNRAFLQEWTDSSQGPPSTRGGIDVDGNGNFYLTGGTHDDLDSASNAGGEDAFIAKFDSTRGFVWGDLLGTSEFTSERGTGIAVHPNGSIYVVGRMRGDLGSGNKKDRHDGFFAKYTADGKREWVQGIHGSQSPPGDVHPTGIVVDDDGNLIVVGESSTGFQGASRVGKADGFVVEYSPDGTRNWVELFGTTDNDEANDVTVGPTGVVYVGGQNGFDPDIGPSTPAEGYAARFQSDGSPGRVQTIGSPQWDRVSGIATDGSSGLFVVGAAGGKIEGHPHPPDPRTPIGFISQLE